MSRLTLPVGTGYVRSDGRYADAEALTVFAGQTLSSGYTISNTFEVGTHRHLALGLTVEAVSGSNPTLDVTMQTSPDGIVWRTMAAFTQRTGVGYAMSAVSSAGTTPPTITLTGTATRPINLKVECTTLGARGDAVLRYSVDGGVSWTSGVTTAATIALTDEYGVATGLTINYANNSAATDNVWTASTVGYERKSFDADRFVRAVALVGGSATPTVTATLTGDAA